MLVSCIMPTANRRHLLPLAVASFLAQDWPECELVVVDDGDDPVGDLFQDAPRIRYHQLDRKLSIGMKRNVCCEIALGEVICHWDDDDWSVPGRITDQVNRLIEADAQMSGYHSIYFYDQRVGKVFAYMGSQDYAVGTSMCYRRSWWDCHRFPDKRFAEDNVLVYRARDEKVLVSTSGLEMLVARVHPDSTSNPDRVGNNNWPEMPLHRLPEGFLEAIGR